MFTCSKCGSNEFEKKEKGPHFGLYCKKCGTWHHWLSKKELKEFHEPTKEENSVNDYVEDEMTLKKRLQEFIDYLDQAIDKEYDKLPISSEDAIRKSSYCLALERDKNALINILDGKRYCDVD